MLTMGVFCLAGLISSISHAKWATAEGELFGVVICLFGAWGGLKLLRAISVFFDWIWPDDQKYQ